MRWLIQDRIIQGKITDSSHQACCKLILELLDEGIHPIHLIIDDSSLTKTSMLPTNLLSTSSIARHPNLGSVVCISGKDHQTPFIDRVISRAYRLNITRVQHVNDAVNFLLENDDTLKNVMDEGTLAQM